MSRLTLPAGGRLAIVTLWLGGMLSAAGAAAGDVPRETIRFFEELHAVADLHGAGRPAEAAARLRPWLQQPDTSRRAAICLYGLLPPEELARWPAGSSRAAAVLSFWQAYFTADPGVPDCLARLLAEAPEVFTWEYTFGLAVRSSTAPDFPRLLREARATEPDNPYIPLALAQLEDRADRYRVPAPAAGTVRGRDAAFVLGEILYRANRLDLAGQLCDRNLRQARRDGDHWRVVECLLQETTLHLAAGDMEAAGRSFAAADEESRRLPLAYLRQRIAFVRGYLCVHQGDLPAAAEAFRSILPGETSQAADRFQAPVLTNLGYVLDELGRYGEALDCYRRVIPFYQRSRDWFSLAMARLDRGALRERLNLLESAREDYQAVLDLPGLPADSEPRLMALGNLGSIYAGKRQWDRAIPLLEQAAALARTAERWDEAAVAGTNLALCHLKRGDLPTARAANAGAADAARQASPITALLVEGVEARLLMASGNPAAAVRRLESMSPRARAMEDRTLAWEILYLKGLAMSALGRHREAGACFEGALAGLAELERECRDLYVTLHFLESAGDVVEGALASLLTRLESGEAPDPLLGRAFEIMESHRARVLDRRIDALAPAVQPAGRPTLTEVRHWIGSRNGSALMVFEGEHHVYRLSFDGRRATLIRNPAPRMRELVGRVEESLLAGAKREQAAATAELASCLRLTAGQGNGELFILPSGCLCRIPLEILPVTGGPPAEPLGIQRAVVYLPSWQFLRRTEASGSPSNSGGSYLGIHGFAGGPAGRRLPWAEQEVTYGAQAIAWNRTLIQPAALLGGSRRHGGTPGPEWTIVHLATHVEVNEEDPWRSRILLEANPSSEGGLTVQDLAEGVWRSNLVVLSGCATGRGRVFRGEGPISLARSCLASGSRAVLTTLWPVADRAAGEFMRHFYDALPRCGGQAALALREARRRMWENPAFRDATHWAGYVLYGLPAPILAPETPGVTDSAFVPTWLAIVLLWLLGAGRAVRGPSRP